MEPTTTQKTIHDLRVHELEALAKAREIEFEPGITKAGLIDLVRGDVKEKPKVKLVTILDNKTTDKFDVDVSDYQSIDLDYVLGQAFPIMDGEIRRLMGRGKKFRISMEAKLVKPDGKEARSTFWGTHNKGSQVILPDANIKSEIEEQAEQMKKGIDEYTSRGSGWVLELISKFRIELYKYEPLSGGTYVRTPKSLASKKAVINVDNSVNKSMDEIRKIATELGITYNTKTGKKRLTELVEAVKPDALKDNKCFKWAVLSCLHPVDDHADRLSNYAPYRDTLNETGVAYPMKVVDVQKFANKNNLIINVFGWGDDEKLNILHTASLQRRADGCESAVV